MLDQAASLRKIVFDSMNPESIDNEKTKAKIITVTSGKGGVGKSNFVVNLAIALQKKGKKVMIFDSDIGMGNDDVLMGVMPKYNVYDVIFNNMEINEVVVNGPQGVKLLSGGMWVTKMDEITDKNRDIFVEKLTKLRDLDYILIDTGAGISRSILGFIACCEDVIVITTPEPTSLTDAYSLLKAIDHFKLKPTVKLVINKTLNIKESLETYSKFSNTVNNFLKINLDYLGRMSEDRKLVESVRKQEPFIIKFPESNVAKDVSYIADRLIGLNTKEKGMGIEKFFKKIFKIFS
ncbi:MinD/ParA family protein [Clostridium rectalis]|uniref:MinD/ParA family protein n=1 Tax=Clostridium rectalis TaxID=2040295 RepID=UPI000F63738F|nr:MinD/ParA family protein [Clostridium rectalis]